MLTGTPEFWRLNQIFDHFGPWNQNFDNFLTENWKNFDV